MTEEKQKSVDEHYIISHRALQFLNLVLANHVFSDVSVLYKNRADGKVTVEFEFTKYR